MEHKQAAKLIIENIQLLEQAKKMLEGEISEKLFLTVDKMIKEHIDRFGEWEGYYNFSEDYLAFAPSHWKAKDTHKFIQNFYARYGLSTKSHEIGGEESEWWLTSFMENEVDQIVFNFYPWRDNFSMCNVKDWRNFADQQNQIYLQIEQLGFKYNAVEASWYLVVEGIKPYIFSENYDNDTLEYALTPITDALDILKQAHPYFDKIVQAAIAKFGRIDIDEAV
ncbi:hypothetical protein KTJ32_18540 [Acinetobacter gyllenbergii]|uniref:hypothetical protein n=1 Tax=Acinetobacter gyllenbergii TaxID=134534 RepID=UPI0021D3622B|nr:hypothetical protein [Acinetobacter gyllenbergii]MCU4582997.1 hypothetical protein [Acinetobacter gyllenbergii]